MAEEAILKRVLPHSIEAEQSVIGSMIMDKDAIVTASEILHGDDFYSKQYGIIFDAMVELHDSAQPVDLITLQNKRRSAGSQQPGICQGPAWHCSDECECCQLCQYRRGEISAAQADPSERRDRKYLLRRQGKSGIYLRGYGEACF